jgi:putative endonuclease
MLFKQSITTKQTGDSGEALALQHLLRAGLLLVARNFKTPGRGGGELDLIMRDAAGTLVFVEVRTRTSSSHGGAAGSITATKQRRIALAARHYLARLPHTPPCRFDVVTVQAGQVQWLQAAFDVS